MARIVTVYISDPRDADREAQAWIPSDMSYVRWFKISEALARRGHQVDVAVPDGTEHWPVDPALLQDVNLGIKPLSSIDWNSYHLVKTLFNRGIETLETYGGIGHPCIISKLGSVVGPRDMPGIYFYGDVRAAMYAAQEKISAHSRYVTLLSDPARILWRQCHGEQTEVLIVPGGVDPRIPSPGADPYPDHGGRRCLFAGLIYDRHSQPEANRTLSSKLNALGRLLQREAIQLYMMGSGDISALDPRYVTYLGVVPYTGCWNYFHHAGAGVVVSAGNFMHNNESSKIYHYLAAGLPVVSERGFPNDHVVEESGLGYLVRNGDIKALAERVAQTMEKPWDKARGMAYVLEQHSWDRRVEVYDRLIAREFDDPYLTAVRQREENNISRHGRLED